MACIELVPVLYVRPCHAKFVKTELEASNKLSKIHRMVKVEVADWSKYDSLHHSHSRYSRPLILLYQGKEKDEVYKESLPEKSNSAAAADIDGPNGLPLELIKGLLPLIAVPITNNVISFNNETSKNEALISKEQLLFRLQIWLEQNCNSKWTRQVVGWGQYLCPFSSAVNGSRRKKISMTCTKQSLPKIDEPCSKIDGESSLFLKHCLYQCVMNFFDVSSEGNTSDCKATRDIQNDENVRLWKDIEILSHKHCPNLQMYALERLGKDTILLPSGTFRFLSCRPGEPLETEVKLLEQFLRTKIRDPDGAVASKSNFQHYLYQTITRRLQYGLDKHIKRLARKCEIDPKSPVRESRCDLLYHDEYPNLNPDELRSLCEFDKGAVGTANSENGPGWITVMEHGIRQSFDFTKVMFSRGNITEKLRFGTECVQRDEIVLDMYAGIGYYTLPAMILGHAKCVYACEWNSNAIVALKYNIKANGLQCMSNDDHEESPHRNGFVRVLEGDCRVSCKKINLFNCVDRISLGLLPSSEGGWPTAVKALKHDRGGWLHVHGNVPTEERNTWSTWLSFRLLQHHNSQYCERKEAAPCEETASNRRNDKAFTSHHPWIAVCHKVVKVKSFAPRIDHLVADVFLGPLHVYYSHEVAPPLDGLANVSDEVDVENVVFTLEGSVLVRHDSMPPPPSCALNSSGPLHQTWMM